MRKIILASQSPRRRELLKDIVEDFTVIPSDAPEIVDKDVKAEDIPEILSLRKALDVAENHADDVVIGADTVVVIDSKVLNKPKDDDEAFEMLKMLSDREHKVITGCAIVCGDKKVSFSVTTKVQFFELSDREISEYIKTGDCADKAGAYGVQSFGKTLVKGICGDYFNVVGLPVAVLKRELEAFLASL